MHRFPQIFVVTSLIFVLLVIACSSSNIKKAESYIAVGMYKEAIVLLQTEIKDNPKNPQGHYLLGLATLFLGSETEASEYFSRAVLINSNYKGKAAEAYFEVGKKYLAEEDQGRARAHFRRAKDLDPEIVPKIEELYIARGVEPSKINEIWVGEITKTIEVPAHLLWISTGISPTPGTKLSIIASGTINYGGPSCGPEGNLRHIAYYGEIPISGKPFGLLIGKMGTNGNPFTIGGRLTIDRVETGEELYLGINDTKFGDNTGYYTVEVEYQPQR